MMSTCSTCIFAAKDHNPNGVLGLTCRRYAPRATEKSWRAEWAYVSGDEWCGEHIANPASADKTQLVSDFAELGNGARNILKCHGIRTVGDLMAHTHVSLLGLPGLGRGSLNQIIHALATIGIKLKINDND